MVIVLLLFLVENEKNNTRGLLAILMTMRMRWYNAAHIA